ncbi:MAG: oligosaccharide flippase family protein [Streptosporangiaceae bacterium]|nr:oligosaccharide flippase family protein [Streptosporangiaceae bacterium]MBV9853670.1 oligosaccharide flippase family protein [Streptosporangiaceae bacterium]
MSVLVTSGARTLGAAPGTGRPDHGRPAAWSPRLPATWPLTVLFAAFPVWWLIGVSSFVWPVVAVPMLVALIWRRRTRAPVAVALWFAFTSWVLLSGLQLDSATKILSFSYRLALYAAAGVLFLYVYNLPRAGWLDAKVLRILTYFWMVVVAGGYAGIVVGAHTFVPPFEYLLPHGLRSQPFVQELVHPVFAEVQGFLGHPVPRPAAPFAYTNTWGGNMGVLTMVALAAVAAAGPGRRRRLLIAVLAASLVPMAFSLNRGMFLSIGVGILYVTARLAVRRRVGALMSLLVLTALLVIAVALTPLGHLVAGSFSSTHGHSNQVRLNLYRLAITGANQSPIFGHGEPQPVTAGQGLAGTPPIGTQGQLWDVLYTNGYPALVLFAGFFGMVLWQTRRARGIAGLWLQAVPLVALTQIAVYGWLPSELQIVMVGAALAYRRCRLPAGGAGTAARGQCRDGSHRAGRSAMGAARPDWRWERPRGGYPRPVTRRGRDGPAALSAEAAVVARGSLVNVAAMVTGAALSFALTVMVSRWLQPSGAGGFFELIALFTILSSTFELGADTGLMRWISRARATGGLADVRWIIVSALAPVLIIGCAAAAAMWVLAPDLAHTFLREMSPGAGAADIRIVAPLVPLGALSACIIDGARGFGRMWPALVIEGLGKPAARIGLVIAALVLGWGLHGAIAAWGLPVILGLVASWLIFARIFRGEVPAPKFPDGPRRGRHGGKPRPPAGRRLRLSREFWGFTAPRAFQGTFQIVVLWLDILLVGAIVSRYAAGVYSAVSKLVLIGTFLLEGNRLAIGPQLSALLARHEHDRAAGLYQSATRLLILASWPLYIVFALFPAVVLGVFGPRYTAGAAALVVLSLAMLINLGTGNVTVVLLMGGKSSWSAINAGAALAINIALNLALLPRIGILGAAIAWAASIAVDNVAAMLEIRWVLGLAPFGKGYALVALTTVGCFGVTGIAARALLGETLPALAAAVAAGAAAFAAALYLGRIPLRLTGIYAVLRPRAGPAAIETPAPGHRPAEFDRR